MLVANNFGDTRAGSLAGPLGLLIIVLLAIGTALLIRNMNARLKRLPLTFPGERDGGDAPAQVDLASPDQQAPSDGDRPPGEEPGGRR